jgi:hypothetical protein
MSPPTSNLLFTCNFVSCESPLTIIPPASVTLSESVLVNEILFAAILPFTSNATVGLVLLIPTKALGSKCKTVLAAPFTFNLKSILFPLFA